MNQKKIQVCVIDDEDVARNALIEVINNSKELQVSCEAKCVDSGFEAIIENNPDLIFLDIKLIGGDAFMILDKLKNRNYNIPPVVINTGFKEFEDAQRALNEYKNEVIAILKKPFLEDWEEKEDMILNKYYELLNSNTKTTIKSNVIIVNTRFKIHVIKVEDILYLEVNKQKRGMAKTLIITDDKEFEISKTLNQIEGQLPPYFVRINRFVIVNGKNIYEYDHSDQVLRIVGISEEFSVGNTYKEKLLEFITNILGSGEY